MMSGEAGAAAQLTMRERLRAQRAKEQLRVVDGNLARFAEAKSGSSRGLGEGEGGSPTAATAASSAETIEQRALREVRDMVVETGRTPWWEDPDARVHERVGQATVANTQARQAAPLPDPQSFERWRQCAGDDPFRLQRGGQFARLSQATRELRRASVPAPAAAGPREAEGLSPAIRVAASRLDRGLSASSRNSMSAPQSLRSGSAAAEQKIAEIEAKVAALGAADRQRRGAARRGVDAAAVVAMVQVGKPTAGAAPS